MPRRKNTTEPEEKPAEKPVNPVGPITFVTLSTVVVVFAVLYIMIGGRLFVQVDVVDGGSSETSLVVCVYENDVSDKLKTGRASELPQALAAVTVEPGSEVELSGRWKGTYTLVIVNAGNERDLRSNIIVCHVDRGETHAAFMLA